MATSIKKTPASTKIVTTTTAKKPAAKKVITATKVDAKTTAAAVVVKKTVAKTATATVKKPPAPNVAAVETKATKTPAVKKAAAQQAPISPEHRYHMICTAAYFLAERRGFAVGYEIQDWISAETEIDGQLKF